MKLSIPAGTTSKRIAIFVADSSSTTGAGLTGLVFNTSSLVCYSWIDTDGNAAGTAQALQTATRGTWTTRGFIEKDSTNMPGWYEFGVPDALLAAGVKWAVLHFKGATNMAPLPIEIEVTAVSNQDAVRGGMTALPNANAEAAGGLYTRGSGAGQINQVANGMVDTNVVRYGGTAGTFASGRPEVNTTHIAGTISPAVAGKVGIDLAQVGIYAAGAFAPTGIIDSGTAQSAGATTLVLRAAAAFADNDLIGATVVIRSATTGAGQRALITGNVGATDTVTLAWPQGAPTGTIVYDIFGTAPGSTVSPPAVNVIQWLGTAVSTPTVAGVPNVNAKTWNDLTTVALPLIPTTAGRTLDVSAAGEAGLDWANIGSPTTAQGLTGTTIATSQVVASVTGAVGSVTGAVASVTGNVGGNVVGSTASVTAGVTVTTNNDKTGYALSATGSAALTESYAADGAAATLPQLLYMLLAVLSEFSISGTTLTAKKLDGSTTAGTFTLDSATSPSSITRAT